MAMKRERNGRWEYVIKRAKLLDKPLYLTFHSESEGDAFCARVEKMLDRGIVPSDLVKPERVLRISDLIRKFIVEAAPKQKDREVLNRLMTEIGDQATVSINVAWVDSWVTTMKRVKKHAPATIRAKVGALSRACTWAHRKGMIDLSSQPFRTLPKGYATYTDLDVQHSGQKVRDVERDRRLEPGEDESIRALIQSGVIPRKQRPRPIEHKASLLADYTLALETGMRLRERYTLTKGQVYLGRRTVHLSATKNGTSREVPLSSVAMKTLEEQLDRCPGEFVFPWWDGDMSPYKLKVTSNYLSKLYADVFEAAGCPDLREHDLRHEATSRFFERTSLSSEEIMKITGHKSHRMVMRYLKLRGSDLASKLW